MYVNHKQFSEALRLVKKFSGPPKHVSAYAASTELTVGTISVNIRKRAGDQEIAIDVPCVVGMTAPQSKLAVPIDAAIKALKVIKPDGGGMVEIDAVSGRPGDFRLGPLTLISGVESPSIDMPRPLGTRVSLRLVGDSLIDALRCVAPAISTDITRNALNGVWIDGGMVATDGCRMHLRPFVEGSALIDHDACDGPVQPYLPRQIVETILAVKKPTGAQLGFRHFMRPGGQPAYPEHWSDGEFRCMSNALDVTVRWQEQVQKRPDWRQLEPRSPNVHLTMPAAVLHSELKLLMAHATDDIWRLVTFRCSATGLTLRARCEGRILDRPLTLTDYNGVYKLSGAAGEGLFSARYLDEAIGALVEKSSEVTLAFKLEDRKATRQASSAEADPEFPRIAGEPPMRVSSAEYPARGFALIMPCRL